MGVIRTNYESQKSSTVLAPRVVIFVVDGFLYM